MGNRNNEQKVSPAQPGVGLAELLIHEAQNANTLALLALKIRATQALHTYREQPHQLTSIRRAITHISNKLKQPEHSTRLIRLFRT